MPKEKLEKSSSRSKKRKFKNTFSERKKKKLTKTGESSSKFNPQYN